MSGLGGELRGYYVLGTITIRDLDPEFRKQEAHWWGIVIPPSLRGIFNESLP